MHELKAKLREWTLPIVACLGVLIAVITVMGRSSPDKKDPESQPPQTVYRSAVAGIGVVEPLSEMIAISVELPGVVRKVLCKVGDHVQAGDPLFALDSRDVDAQIHILDSSLSAAKVQAEDAAQQFILVSQVADKRAVSKDELNRKRFAKQLTHEKVKEIGAQLQQAKITRERLTVQAPIAGDILEVNIHPGEYASAGFLETPLIRMGDVSKLVVRAEIDEEFAARVRPTHQASGYPRGRTETPLSLTFLRFEPYVKPKQNLAVAGSRVDTRVLQVLYTIDMSTPPVFVGQQMDVFIDSDQQAPKASGEESAAEKTS